jgi:hypothetical protein
MITGTKEKSNQSFHYKTFTNSNIIIFSLLGTGEGSQGPNKPKLLSTSLGGS